LRRRPENYRDGHITIKLKVNATEAGNNDNDDDTNIPWDLVHAAYEQPAPVAIGANRTVRGTLDAALFAGRAAGSIRSEVGTLARAQQFSFRKKRHISMSYRK
jgi:hypothetical protein